MTFNAEGGPLEGAAPVYLQISFDNGSNWTRQLMSGGANIWSFTNTVPDNAPFAIVWFENSSGSVTDSNNGANWSVSIRDCEAPTGPSAAAFDPAAPTGCDPVVIRYYPNEGPLQGAATVKIHVGRNGWQDVIAPDPAMTPVGTHWEYTYVMETNTTVIDAVFNNGAGVWDNNGGNDWHVNVADCGDQPPPPATVSISPTNPVGCGPVTVTYNPSGRNLLGADPVKIHIGRNGWQDVIQPNPAMTRSGANWTYVYTPIPGTEVIDMVFNDGGAVWDNNSGADWHVAVADCVEVPAGLAITNPPANVSVSNSVDRFDLFGIAEGMEGHLAWTNNLTGEAGTLPATALWSVPGIALGIGGNEITVRGTNSVPAGTVTNAADNSADAAYSSGWNAGNNGGSGFGAWTFSHAQGEGFAGVFVADPANTGISGLGSSAFGFYANPAGSGANAEVQRDFSSPLPVGSTFRFHLGLNWDSNNEGSNRGFNLLAGDTELINLNMGNSQTITINGETLFANYGSQAMPLSFEYVADGSIRVRGTGRDGTESFDQTVAVPAGAPSRIKFYFNATDSADERQMYFNHLAITLPSAGGVATNRDFVIITRLPKDGPVFSGMTPTGEGSGGFAFRLANTAVGSTYAVWQSPSLFPDPAWVLVPGSAQPGSGGLLDLSITNGLLEPMNFYQIRVSTP